MDENKVPVTVENAISTAEEKAIAEAKAQAEADAAELAYVKTYARQMEQANLAISQSVAVCNNAKSYMFLGIGAGAAAAGVGILFGAFRR